MLAKDIELSPFRSSFVGNSCRWTIAIALSLPCIFLCSYFMTNLITPDEIEKKIYSFLSVDFVRLEPSKAPEIKPDEETLAPEEPEIKPPEPIIQNDQAAAPTPSQQPLRVNALDAIPLNFSLSPPNFSAAVAPPVKSVEPSFNEQLFPLFTPKANYPRRAKRAGIEGWVNISFIINTDGKVSDIEVLSAEPEGVFEKATIKAVKKRKYKPQLLAGKPSARKVVQTIEFKLEK